MSSNRKENNIPSNSWTNINSYNIGPSAEGQQIHNNNQQHPERYAAFLLPVYYPTSEQQQHHHQQQLQQQQQQQQQSFSNYELFSSNSYVPVTQDVKNINNYDYSNEGTANMIINQLVTNWTPNLSGTYSPFGEQNQHQMQQHQQHQQQQQLKNQFIQQSPLFNEHFNHSQQQQQQQQQMPQDSLNVKTQFAAPQNLAHSTLAKTNGNLENNNPTKQNNVEITRKRIVAEVKPMRMSYSDVLSKNVSNAINNLNGNSTSINATSKTATATINSNFDSTQNRNMIKNSVPGDKNKSGLQTEKKSSYNTQTNNDDKDKSEVKQQQNQQQRKYETPSSVQKIYDDNFQQKEKRKYNTMSTSGGNCGSDDSSQSITKNKKTTQFSKTKSQKPTDVNMNSTNSSNKKRFSSKKDLNDDFRTNNSKMMNDGLYNVARKDNVSNNTASERKISQYGNSMSTSSKKGNKFNLSSSSTLSNSSSVKFPPSSSSASTSTSLISSSLSSNSRQNSSKRYQRQQQNQQKNMFSYDLVMKFFEKWLEYTMKIITWLFYLIYDIIVLGFSIVCERFYAIYDLLYTYITNCYKDLKSGNFGKVWIKNMFKKFDMRFKKNSKFAFWRRFFNKKKPPETVTSDFYKNGRLPQTGDEAMYSLLNCKGKDAYSILGVTADSSQEQIRKHYKKIAVLVHPDKNKQPGAEEAFKVLQRAFELIGEPENRKKYDQSLAEALNAEKAWTELHDLLSQLQSKIAEAANTIRCSSCGLRHPRKLTERPHFAARECSSCKIRHSAREGDIWAETSIFGLRWKYLALMEGKVYDITEWANCQKGALSQLQPNSHVVQYRIVRGGQQQQQQQQQQQTSSNQDKDKFKRDIPTEPSLDEFLDNLYSGQNPNQHQSSSRKRTKRN